jgi:dynein heavy chain
MGRVEEIISEGEYTLENAKKSCFAVEGLYMWVKAIRDYFYIFRELEPRRDALILAEKQYNDKLEAENSKKSIIADLEQRLDQLRSHQIDKTKLVEELKLQIQDQMVRKRRADALLRGLSSEKQKWIVCSRMLDAKY